MLFLGLLLKLLELTYFFNFFFYFFFFFFLTNHSRGLCVQVASTGFSSLARQPWGSQVRTNAVAARGAAQPAKRLQVKPSWSLGELFGQTLGLKRALGLAALIGCAPGLLL
jgi:hypothetical protein